MPRVTQHGTEHELELLPSFSFFLFFGVGGGFSFSFSFLFFSDLSFYFWG